jgi:hypothetical protein
MKTERNYTTAKRMSEVLAETFERGDQTSIGHALRIPQQHVQEWTVDGARRNSFDEVAIIIETLRANGNGRADEPFLALARRLGFVAFRADDRNSDDFSFAELLREVSDVIEEKAKAEADGWTAAEHRCMAQRLSELIERASAVRADHVIKADEMDKRLPIRSVR